MKYGSIKKIYAFICAVMALAACSSDDGLQQGSMPMEGSFLPISDAEFHPLGDKMTVAYTAEADWYLANMTDWLRVSPSKGQAGTTMITIEAKPNVTDSRRVCSLVFKMTGRNQDTFNMYQDPAILTVRKAYDSETSDAIGYSLGWRQCNEMFEVESNIEWVMTLDNKDEFSLSLDGVQESDEGYYVEGDKTVTFNALNNNLGDREAEAVIMLRPVKRDNRGNVVDVDVDLDVRVDITQDYLYFLINGERDGGDLTDEPFSELGHEYVSSENSGVDAAGHRTVHEVTVACEAGWDYNTEQFSGDWWLSVEPLDTSEPLPIEGTEGRTYTETRLRITVNAPNPERTQRQGEIIFSVSDVPDASRSVKIAQEGYRLGLETSESVVFDNLSGATEVSLVTAGPWSIDSSDVPEWLTVEPLDGIGPQTITVTAPEQNLDFQDLSDRLTVISGLNALTQDVEVTQERFLFELDYPDELKSALSRLDMNEYDVVLTSSGPWTFTLTSPDQDNTAWLDVRAVSESQTVEMEDDMIHGDAGVWTFKVNANSPNESGILQRMKSLSMTSDLHDDGEGWPAEGMAGLDIVQDIYRFNLMTGSGAGSDDLSGTVRSVPAYTASENSGSFYIQCGAPWRIISKPDWIDLSLMEDASGRYQTITYTVEDNVEDGWESQREERILIRSYKTLMELPFDADTEGEDKYFTISQDAFRFNVNASDDYSRTALETSSMSFEVDCTEDAPWSVRCDSVWVNIGSAGGRGDGIGSFSLVNNGGLFQRSAEVIVRSDVVSKEIPIRVSQGAYRFDSSPQVLPAFSELDPSGLTADVGCMGSWYVSDKPSWIILSDVSGTGDAVISVNASENLGKARDGIFRITSKVGGYTHTKEVTVSQLDFVWDVTSGPETIEADVLDGATGAMSFVCSGAWTASVDKDFVRIDKNAGSGGRSVTETVRVTSVDANYTTEERSATLTVQSVDLSSGKTTLTVSQPAYDFNVEDVSGEFAYDGETKTVTATATGALTATSSQSWLTATISDGLLTLKAAANTETSSRTATVTVSVPDEHLRHNSALAKTLTVTQAAAPAPETGK